MAGLPNVPNHFQSNTEISRDDFSISVLVESLSATWTIKNFLFRDGNVLHSNIISSGAVDSNEWKLVIFPRIDLQEPYYSIYLEMVSGEKCTVKSIFSVVKHDCTVKSEHFTEEFTNCGSYHGFEQFVTREDLINDTLPYLVQGNLTIQCTLIIKTPRFNIRIQNTFNMENVFQSKKFADAVLVVEGNKSFPVHRAILSARSQIFAKIFELNFQTPETQLNRVEISNMDSDTMEELLRYIYTGSTRPLDFDLAESLFIAADKYILNDLKKLCLRELINKLTLENASKLFTLARDYEEPEALTRAEALVQFL